jgi:hypothetical protein
VAFLPAADNTGWRQVRIRTTTASVSGNGGVGYAVPTAVNGGSELLILVPRAAHSLSRPTPPAPPVSQVSDPPAGWPASTPPPSDAWGEPLLTHDTFFAVSRQQCYGTDRGLNETLDFAIVFRTRNSRAWTSAAIATAPGGAIGCADPVYHRSGPDLGM